jgi:hypothetical protein
MLKKFHYAMFCEILNLGENGDEVQTACVDLYILTYIKTHKSLSFCSWSGEIRMLENDGLGTCGTF